MKKAISLLTVFAMMTSFACFFSSCKKDDSSSGGKSLLRSVAHSEKETETEPVIPTDTVPTDTVPTDTDPTDTSRDSLQKTSVETTSYDCPVSVIGPHEIPSYEYKDIQIADTLILDKDGLTIHVNGFDLGLGTERMLLMHLDNQTGHPISLSLRYLSVDGFNVLPMWLKKFDDGASEDFDVGFYMTLGNEIGLWDPGMFEISFEVEYTDTEASYVSDRAKFSTSVYDPNKVYDLSYAAVLVENENVRISAVDYVIYNGEPRLYLMYENLSAEEEYTFRFDESLLNGVPASLFTVVTLGPGEKQIDTIYLGESYLEECGIDSIETISAIMMYSGKDEYFNGTLCDPFTLSVV
ncbi:MAG: hypothetical protein IKX04_02820 [Clostridiales bacterium]|nr:hypothetical protein [Clostridiales bacterium]MBR4819461.1 hypothetical protein [Clostridiales bacterium]MBR5040351.1 hypothetical protein [Clostridiales bacterium]MBR5057478.1 hypothetical protein [Clostridiales bacterium]